MQAKTRLDDQAVLNDLIEFWKLLEPVEAYIAGYPSARGKLFDPSESNRAEVLDRAARLLAQVENFADHELREHARLFLRGVAVGLNCSSPEQMINQCALAIWFVGIRNDAGRRFVGPMLRSAAALIQTEHERWQARSYPGETRVACVNACDFLQAMAIELATLNPTLLNEVSLFADAGAKFRTIFSYPVSANPSFKELFAFLEINAQPPQANPHYAQILECIWGYSAPADKMLAEARKMLKEELASLRRIVRRFEKLTRQSIGPDLGDAYTWLNSRYRVKGNVTEAARGVMRVLNRFVNEHLQELGLHSRIKLFTTPSYLFPITTSGATIAYDHATAAPKVRVYVTAERNRSWLTLINVLVHEATHAYQFAQLSAFTGVSALARIKTGFAVPVLEAMAFHRELELFLAAKGEVEPKQQLSRVERELLRMIDKPPYPLAEDIAALEFETRIWRVIRALRAIGDIEVHTGKRTYTEFVRWAGARTGLSLELVHNECFSFLSIPGYTPAYACCGAEYAVLQKSARTRGVSALDFNTRASGLGFLPWSFCVKRMEAFGPARLSPDPTE
jgi:hypothetical protein